MKLIDKDALLAEIDRLISVRPDENLQTTIQSQISWLSGKAFCITSLNSFIETLEVKEMDLEKEFENYMDKYNGVWVDSDYIRFAKHFFELGMKTSNPLTWEDIACIEDITSTILTECKDKILYDTQESLCKEILKRFKAQKGEKV